MTNVIAFEKKYKPYILLLYCPVYLILFHILEHYQIDNIHIISCPLDAYIPFVEIFVIPYLFWFIYVAGFVVYFLWKDQESYYRMMYFLICGMSLFLFISFVYPNGLHLRPETFPHDNLFVQMIQIIYSQDTAINVLPSIHVYNSIGVMIAVKYSKVFKDKIRIQGIIHLIGYSIILSTLFIKQHSVIDVLLALFLAFLFYCLIWKGGRQFAET